VLFQMFRDSCVEYQARTHLPHPLCRVRYIKTFVVWPEDGHHRSVAFLHIQDDLLLGDIEHMNPIEALKDPPRRWALSGVSFLVGIRLACFGPAGYATAELSVSRKKG